MLNTKERLVQALDRSEAEYLAAINASARGEPGAGERLALAKQAMDDVSGIVAQVLGNTIAQRPVDCNTLIGEDMPSHEHWDRVYSSLCMQSEPSRTKNVPSHMAMGSNR